MYIDILTVFHCVVFVFPFLCVVFLRLVLAFKPALKTKTKIRMINHQLHFCEMPVNALSLAYLDKQYCYIQSWWVLPKGSLFWVAPSQPVASHQSCNYQNSDNIYSWSTTMVTINSDDTVLFNSMALSWSLGQDSLSFLFVYVYVVKMSPRGVKFVELIPNFLKLNTLQEYATDVIIHLSPSSTSSHEISTSSHELSQSTNSHEVWICYMKSTG